MESWSLATPLALLLLPLPLVASWALPRHNAESGALIVPDSIASLLAEQKRSASGAVERRIIPVLIWGALVAALSGPQQLVSTKALPASGRDLVLALDVSGSMDREDFQLAGRPASRLDAVKAIAARFVRDREGDRVGLVLFAKEAFFAAALTFDIKAVAQTIEEVTIGIARRSTAIGDGLGLALKRLERSSAPSRVVILLSDGVNNAGTVVPTDAAALAQRLGVKVHTIALGPHDMDASTDENDIVDARSLLAIAEASGGAAFRVHTTEDLNAVARAIDALETNPEEAPPATIYRNYWTYPAVLALMLSVLFILSGYRRRA